VLGRLSRRDFARIALAGAIPAPLFAQARRPNRSYINGVQFGLQPFCYHDLAMTPENRPELIRRLVQNEMGMVELHATWVEPRLDALGVSPDRAREALRQWRLEAAPEFYRAIRKEFDDTGIEICTYYVNFADFTDAELDASFGAAKILGAKGCVGSYGLKFAQRIAGFAGRHAMFMGLHNHANLSDPDALATEESFIKGLAISPDFRITLDIRHYTAANGDCLAFMKKHHAHIAGIHLGDRRRNNGRSTPFGEGDAPIIEILRLIRDNRWPIIALLEFEHGTLRTEVEEVRLMYDYCKRALA
jgi:sugar phosphate isomerase/epimerase